jgi:hypothetical protein
LGLLAITLLLLPFAPPPLLLATALKLEKSNVIGSGCLELSAVACAGSRLNASGWLARGAAEADDPARSVEGRFDAGGHGQGSL